MYNTGLKVQLSMRDNESAKNLAKLKQKKHVPSSLLDQEKEMEG